MKSCEMYVITDPESDTIDLNNFSPDYITKAVRAYERKQETARAYYARMKENPEWVQKRREQARASRLRKKMGSQSTSPSSASTSSSS